MKNGAAQDYHGYGAVDLYAVEPHLGTLRDYQELVNAAHQQHMKILFRYRAEPRRSAPSVGDESAVAGLVSRNPQHHTNSSTPADGGHFMEGRSEQQIANDPFEILVGPARAATLLAQSDGRMVFGVLAGYEYGKSVGGAVFVAERIWWAESSGLDGFRVDTFPYVSRQFWARWHAGLRRIYPRLTTIGEVFHPDASVTSFFAGGQKRFDGIDSGVTTVFDYPMYFALRDVLLSGASGWTYRGCAAARFAVSAAGRAGHFFRES